MGGLLATLMAGSVVAFAQEVAEDLEMGQEAWFFRHRDPIEPVPPAPGGLSDATEIPRATVRDQTNPYRTETLHVGVNLGEEEAIAFLGLPVTELGFDVQITGGTITLPISGFGGQQERNPEGADMIACVATDLIVDEHGGNWENQYNFDCGTRADVVLDEGSDPLTWTIDLAPFTAAWEADPAVQPGIAIVPNPDTELTPPEQTWHVSWQNRFYQPQDADDPEKRPITVTVSFIEEELPTFDDFDEPAAFDPGQDQFTAAPGGDFRTSPNTFAPPAGAATGFAPPPPVDERDPEAADGEPVPDAAPADERVAAPPTEPVAIRTHPALYLLPFLAVGLAGLLGYSLSHQPVLPHSREGAVSALMRKRRSAPVTSP